MYKIIVIVSALLFLSACASEPEKEYITIEKTAPLSIPSHWLYPCEHPVPARTTLSNTEVYYWISEYQTTLEECNDKLGKIRTLNSDTKKAP